MKSNKGLICDCDDCKKAKREPIPTQEQVMSPEAAQLLRNGINLAKLKPVLKDLINSVLVDQALSGEAQQITIHWSIHGSLRNWLRAEWPKVPIMSWPWGSWWQVRVTGAYDKEAGRSNLTIHNLVVK